MHSKQSTIIINRIPIIPNIILLSRQSLTSQLYNTVTYFLNGCHLYPPHYAYSTGSSITHVFDVEFGAKKYRTLSRTSVRSPSQPSSISHFCDCARSIELKLAPMSAHTRSKPLVCAREPNYCAVLTLRLLGSRALERVLSCFFSLAHDFAVQVRFSQNVFGQCLPKRRLRLYLRQLPSASAHQKPHHQSCRPKRSLQTHVFILRAQKKSYFVALFHPLFSLA